MSQRTGSLRGVDADVGDAMALHAPRVAAHEPAAKWLDVSRPIVLGGEWAGVASTIRVEDRQFDIWYRVSCGPVADGADAFLAGSLLPAMMTGSDLRVRGPVSDRLRASLPEIQTIFDAWIPDSRKVVVTAPERRDTRATRTEDVGCFFSGGVDSFYTLLKHRPQITKVILVHGFDMRLDDVALRERVSRAINEAGAELGVDVVEVETNLREFADRYAAWALYHGAALASVAHVLAPQIGKVYVAAADSYASIGPWGTHPLLDPLWSTDAMEVVHDGLEATRLDKVSRLVREPVAMKHLRVCWRNPDGAYNCGRCEKCLTTLLCLRACNALDSCRTFDGALDLRELVRLPPPDNARMVVGDILRGLVESGADPELTRTLQQWLAKADRVGLRNLVARVLSRLRRMLTQNG